MSDIKNIQITKEANAIIEELREAQIVSEKADAFRLGVVLALKLDPNVKKPSKQPKLDRNLADTGGMDKDGLLAFSTRKLSNEIENDEVYKRIVVLGIWGLKKIKSDYWDGSTINWEKINSDINEAN